MNKLRTLYVVRVVGDNELDGLVFTNGGDDVFETTSLEYAKSYRDLCQAENNQINRPKYYVCKVECV